MRSSCCAMPMTGKPTAVDLQLDWRIDLGPGQLGVNWLVAWVDSVTVGVHTGNVPPEELVGTIGTFAGGSFAVGTSLPEWKSNLHLSYAWRDLTMGASWRYIDSMTDADPRRIRCSAFRMSTTST